jgi:hypothetical protein
VLELVLVDQPGKHHPHADVGRGDEGPGGHGQAVEQGQVAAPEPVQGRDGPDERGPPRAVRPRVAVMATPAAFTGYDS